MTGLTILRVPWFFGLACSPLLRWAPTKARIAARKLGAVPNNAPALPQFAPRPYLAQFLTTTLNSDDSSHAQSRVSLLAYCSVIPIQRRIEPRRYLGLSTVIVTGIVPGSACQRKSSMTTVEPISLSPESQMANRRSIVSPGLTGLEL